MKRIWFTQQKPFNYMPLRAGLGLITMLDFEDYKNHFIFPVYKGNIYQIDRDEWGGRDCLSLELCPKLYTVRTHRLEGEYIVVDGSRYKAKPVEPSITFKATPQHRLTLKNIGWYCNNREDGHPEFPSQDLGIQGATYEDLKKTLISLNSKTTDDTLFWINRLEPIQQRRGEVEQLQVPR